MSPAAAVLLVILGAVARLCGRKRKHGCIRVRQPDLSKLPAPDWQGMRRYSRTRIYRHGIVRPSADPRWLRVGPQCEFSD
jgi:hypothetical protein